MIEILKSNFYVPIYGLTWVLSIVNLPKYYDSYLKFLPIIIGYTFFTEILGVLILEMDIFALIPNEEYAYYNIIVYTIYDIIFFPFFYFIYWKSSNSHQQKKIIKFGGVIFISTMIVNAIFKNPMIEELVYGYLIGSLVLIFSVSTYLYQLYRYPTPISLSKNLLFWISIGLLIFHLGYTPIVFLRNSNFLPDGEDFQTLRKINHYLIIIMYACFSIGFVKMKRFKTNFKPY